ncbi:MAG TPA: shikimate dehydrogenase [Gemmatimonadaceae bacterium]|jgi:shikimate dehydrogenase|nr:shikimate dehydrogenase [Gemmatimonadaceae bacterium]
MPSRLVLLGHPVVHSLSPAMQNAAMRSVGIEIDYEALDVLPDELGGVLDGLAGARGAGNVTIPHKRSAAARCARLTPVAERVAAVNTFWVEGDGALVGDNTDVEAFDLLARQTLGTPPAGLRIALLGAGGGARAVLAAAERWRECTVAIYNRTEPRAAELAGHFSIVTDVHDAMAPALHGAALVVNATPVGMEDARHPAPLEALDPGAVVIDLVYRAGQTAWVREARARGHRAADGLGMLVEQGALAFERWFGIPAPRAVMRQVVGRASITHS